MNVVQIHLVAGWTGMLGGVISGAGIGLFFHRERWLGGYAALARRLIRLGHIAFFGLGFLNLFFAMSIAQAPIAPALANVASKALIAGAIAMPLCCFAAAWRTSLRHLFPIPVACVLVGIVGLLIGWAIQ